MSFFRHPVLAIKRADSGFLYYVKSLIRSILSFSLPVPAGLKPLFRLAYVLHYSILESSRQFISAMYRVPLFKGRCHSVGKRLRVGLMPYVTGKVIITLGDNVHISGKLSIAAGRVYDSARFTVGSNVFIGNDAAFMIAEEIVIEDHVSISARCVFADNDSHPIDPTLRSSGMPPFAKDVRPIRICRNAWIGRGSCVLKGVTIGEGAIVGAGSVVTNSIPAFSIARGNPAQVIRSIPRATPEDN